MMLEWTAVTAIVATSAFLSSLLSSLATWFFTRGKDEGSQAEKITMAERSAQSASAMAAASLAESKSLGQSLSMFREQVARDYVSREVLREFEDRITRSIERLSEKFDRVLEK